MISLGFVTDPEFIDRYCDETELYVFPLALEVNFEMYKELINLVVSRRQYLSDSGYLAEAARKKEESEQAVYTITTKPVYTCGKI